MAVTDRLVVIETVQMPVPVQAPDQPANSFPESGVAVSVTEVLIANGAIHAVPQSMPEGEEVMVPFPVPERTTVSVTRG